MMNLRSGLPALAILMRCSGDIKRRLTSPNSKMSDNEGWTTVAPKKKPATRISVQMVQQQVASSVARSIETKADQGALKQKRVDPVSIAELVKARLAAGQTQEQADAACALPKNTIKKIEAGHLIPGAGYLRAISRTLKVNLRFI